MNNEINYVSPFKKFVITVGNLPTAYMESMSYYEAITFLVNYLSNNVIPALNNNGLVVEELQAKFTELKNYVDHYFDNLDVQEEINNKLDQMLEDGVLEQIIEQYLNSSALWCFDSVDDMKTATNLIDGSYARTLGYYTANDGGGATYRITDTESEIDYQESLENGLYATLIIKNYNNIEEFGVKGDGVTDDTLKIQNALNFDIKNLTFKKSYKITNALTISNPKNLYFENAIIEQATWGYSAFIIDSNNVNFYGKCRLINNQERTVITEPSIERVTDAKSTCAGIYIKLNKDNLYFDDLYIYGFVCGITCNGGENVNHVDINNLSIENVDFGFIGNGVNYLTFNNVYFKDISNSQNEPTHVIYITQNETTYKGLYINSIQGEGITDNDNSACVLSIKSMEDYCINSIVCDNIVGIITGNYSKGIINSVVASGIHGTGFILNNESDLVINNANVESDATTTSIYATRGDSNMIIKNSITKIDVNSAYSVFDTSNGGMTIDKPIITYTVENNAYTFNSTGTGDYYLIEPKVENHTKILKSAGRSTPYHCIINPELVTLSSDSFYIGGSGTGTNYQIFTTKAYKPTDLNLTADEPKLYYSNYYKLVNTTQVSLTRIYGIQGQEITLINDTLATSLVNGSYIKTKTGETITGSNWKVAKFIIYDGVAYQL